MTTKNKIASAVLASAICLLFCGSTPLSAQTTWNGAGRYGAPYGGLNSAYAPTFPNGAMGGNNFSNPNYMNFGASSNPYMGTTTYGSSQTTQTSPLSDMVMNLLLGDGDFTARFWQTILQGSVLYAFIRLTGGGYGGGLSQAMYTGTYNRYSGGSNQSSTRPKAAAESSDPKLNICDANKLLGPTQEVSQLNKDLLRIIY